MAKEEDPVVHHPEFVVLDGDEEAHVHQESVAGKGEYFEALNRLESRHFPIYIRVLLFLLSLGLVFLVLFFLIGTLMAILVGCLTLFRNEINLGFIRKNWSACKKLTAVTLGVFVAAFSPPFGLAIILLYLVMHGENINQGIAGRVFRG